MLLKFGEGYINSDYIAHLFKVDGNVVNVKTGRVEYTICIVSSIDGWTRFGEKFDCKVRRDTRFNEIVKELNKT